MSTLKVDTIASDTTPTVTISDGLTVSGVTTTTGDISIADTIAVSYTHLTLPTIYSV